ncbi:hypothetical protein BTHE68_61220 (plasmid) [Burkholderia sp. THE68]|nr:hypothetical protein BTHE68_61220 [Burkholderia sp. THE68]
MTYQYRLSYVQCQQNFKHVARKGSGIVGPLRIPARIAMAAKIDGYETAIGGCGFRQGAPYAAALAATVKQNARCSGTP